MQLRFKNKTTTSRGRNGLINTAGLDILSSDTEEVIILSPTLSNGRVADACWIEIPLEDIPALIEHLKSLIHELSETNQ